MKVRGTTLTTPIARHAIPDDSAVSSKPWSSQNTVDKLCPAFTESGAVVTCEPVDGYPLEVEWQTKNLFNDVAWYESHRFTLQEDGSWYCSGLNKTCFTNTEKRPGAMYLTATMKTDVTTTPFYLIAYYTDGTVSPTLAASIPGETFTTKTLTTDPTKTVDYIKWTYGGGGSYYLKDVMISFVDNVYEPYAETATIIRCGKNMWNPANVYSGYFTGDAASIVYSSPSKICYIRCRPNTTYTVSKKAGQRFAIGYTTERPTAGVFVYSGIRKDKEERLTYTTGADAAYLVVWAYNGNADTTITADEMFATVQIEEGNTATAYEPYKGDTFAPGEAITALSGANTISADAGIVTVTGKANPAAEIEKLKNAILAMGANV